MHRAVMLAETVQALTEAGPGLYVDGTVGAAGHAVALVQATAPDGRLLGIDRDPAALSLAKARLAPFGRRVRLHQASFDDLEPLLAGEKAAAILLDLGVSSMQLEQSQRGFSFSVDGPLDMRMDPQGPGAAQLLATLSQKELAALITRHGQERFASRIAAAIWRQQQAEAITTTGRLAAIVTGALPASERRRRRHHPATKTFQALRIAVNDELGRLERFLERVPAWLRPAGRLAIISYHSLEDRRVKRAMAAWADPCTCPDTLARCLCGRRPLFHLPRKKPLRPGPQELAANPRARSARLRVALRTSEAA